MNYVENYGLVRHADHHAAPASPDESPELATGYGAMAPRVEAWRRRQFDA